MLIVPVGPSISEKSWMEFGLIVRPLERPGAEGVLTRVIIN